MPAYGLIGRGLAYKGAMNEGGPDITGLLVAWSKGDEEALVKDCAERVQQAPAASFYENQAAFESVAGPVAQIVLASVVGYVAGQFINSWVLVRMKQATAERGLFARLATSTGAGELADTFLFCAIAASAIG